MFARECDIVVICDSSQDPEESFDDMFKMLKLARQKLACSFRLNKNTAPYVKSADVESLMLHDFSNYKHTLHFRFEVVYRYEMLASVINADVWEERPCGPSDCLEAARPSHYSIVQSCSRLVNRVSAWFLPLLVPCSSVGLL